jgi:excisionase family DNA binding protein
MSAPCTVCAGPTIRSDDGTRICLNASCPGDVTEHRQLDLIHRSLTEGRSNREDSGSEDNRPGPESARQGKEEGSRRRRAPRGRRQRNRPGAAMTALDGVPRLALSVSEACQALGVGWDYWREHIAPEVRIVRRGRRKLVPVSELQAWLEANAERVLP